MGTTLEKVQAAQASKEDCFDAIVEMGGTITTSTKFADYGDAIRSIPAGEVPETDAESAHVLYGKKFVRNVDDVAVLTEGTMDFATFYEEDSKVICSRSGYTGTDTVVYTIPAPGSAVFSYTVGNSGADVICSTAGWTGTGVTVSTIPAATISNPGDGNIVAGNDGTVRQGTIISMSEPGGLYFDYSTPGQVNLRWGTPGWVGTYTASQYIPLAVFETSTNYSGGLDVVCSGSGYTEEDTTVTTISGATMSMDYSGGTVFSGEGYASNETLVLEPSTMTVSGATVYATQGYQNGTQYTEVQSGTVTETDSTIEISEGYVQAGTYSKGGGGGVPPMPTTGWQDVGFTTLTAGEKGAWIKWDVVFTFSYWIGDSYVYSIMINSDEMVLAGATFAYDPEGTYIQVQASGTRYLSPGDTVILYNAGGQTSKRYCQFAQCE